MKSFYTVSLSQILLRSPHKNYLGFIRVYYKKKFEKLFILPKEKALATGNEVTQVSPLTFSEQPLVVFATPQGTAS